MSPRRGGEADKVGNRYELTWIVLQALYVLGGTADRIVVEEYGEIGDGAELRIQRPGGQEVHQLKRQNGTAESWTVNALAAKGVLTAASFHTSEGREFRFVSTIPARRMQELSDIARTHQDCQAFLDAVPESLENIWKDVHARVGGEAKAWTMLRRSHFECASEEHLEEQAEVLAATTLHGTSPRQAVATLGRLMWRKLNHPMGAAELEALLGEHGIQRWSHLRGAAVRETVEAALTQWVQGVSGELLTPAIPRAEAQRAMQELRGDRRMIFMVGDAGSGKSAAIYQLVDHARAEGWAVSALRLDWLPPFKTTIEMGHQIGLDISPVSALAAMAPGKPALLVVDQVDAVSLLSGRMPDSFAAVQTLTREASVFPNIRIVLACRRFDADNDERIRSLIAAGGDVLSVGDLDDDQIDHALNAAGLDPATLDAIQRELLRSPLNLVLLTQCADGGDTPTFHTRNELLSAYWTRKMRACRARRTPPPHFTETVRAVVKEMGERRSLALDATAITAGPLGEDIDVLMSEHVLVNHYGKLSFFHEAFFDFAFAVTWKTTGQTLIDYLLHTDQELFHRGQVRQVLTYLHDDDGERFAREVVELLQHDRVRFHIKTVIIAVLRNLANPNIEDWDAVAQVAASTPELAGRVMEATITAAWFDLLDDEGLIEPLFRGGPPERSRAGRFVVACAAPRPDRLAQIIKPYAGRDPDYPRWLADLARFAGPEHSRPVFDQVLAALRQGTYPGRPELVWQSAYRLPRAQPRWALELLQTFLADQPGAWDLDEGGELPFLSTTEYCALETVTHLAGREPHALAEWYVPYLLKALDATRGDGSRPLPATAFPTIRLMNSGLPAHDLSESLWSGGRDALRHLAVTDPPTTAPLITALADSEFAAAQVLLYEVLVADPKVYASDAAALMLQGSHRLAGSDWVPMVWIAAIGLLRAIAPHLDQDTHDRLANAIGGLRVPESRGQFGWHEYQLLAALDENRLERPAAMRLAELRRRYGTFAPPDRRRIRVGVIGSPIPPAAQSRMSDKQWLGAMRRYADDDTDWHRLTGGAGQLSGDLRDQTTRQPLRFAQLALRMDRDLDSRYLAAVLQGLSGKADEVPAEVAFDLVRHAAAMSHALVDRYLAEPLKNRDGSIPYDITMLLLDRATLSSDPANDSRGFVGDAGYALGEKLFIGGLNTARGALRLALADLAAGDPSGSIARQVALRLDILVSDPSLAVRSCTAPLIRACLPYAGGQCVEAFTALLDADDALLSTWPVRTLTAQLAHTEPDVAVQVIEAMIASAVEQVRRAGGELAAYAGLELELTDLLNSAARSDDAAVREGVAEECAQLLTTTGSPDIAARLLANAVNDPDESVRTAAITAVPTLRSLALAPFRDLLLAVIASPAFSAVATQLVFTLIAAPDRIDDIAAECIKHFLATRNPPVPGNSWDHDAEEMMELAIRALTQARTARARRNVLTIIDQLMATTNAGQNLVDGAER